MLKLDKWYGNWNNNEKVEILVGVEHFNINIYKKKV